MTKQAIENTIRHNRLPFAVHQLWAAFAKKDRAIKQLRAATGRTVSARQSAPNQSHPLSGNNEPMNTKQEIDPTAIYWASFNRFELRLPGQAVLDCSHSGACDDDVEHWAPRIPRPVQCTPAALRAELKEYGAWDADELADDAANWQRIVWLAAGNVRDGDEPDFSPPVSEGGAL